LFKLNRYAENNRVSLLTGVVASGFFVNIAKQYKDASVTAMESVAP
jgi:hypothetical protein